MKWLVAALLVGGCSASNHKSKDLGDDNDLSMNEPSDLAVDSDSGFQPPAQDLTVPTQVTYGISSRPSNPTCLAPPRPPVIPTGDYTLEPLFPNLSTGTEAPIDRTSPIMIKRVRLPTTQADPANPGKVLPGPYVWVMGLRNGRVFVITDPSAAAPPSKNLLDPYISTDMTQSEGGFIGFEFDPDLATDPSRAYIYYVEGDYGYQSLYRAHLDVTVSGGNYVYATSSPTVILQAASDFEHHDGDVHFGPDGYLYFSTGDGAKPTVARSTKTLRGKLLRIDVHSTALTANYGIPSDNPYRSNGATPNPACVENGADPALSATDCPEIWAVGLRNPFRFNFDDQGGAMIIADVAPNDELDIGARGADYGWDTQNGLTSSDPSITSAVALMPNDGCDQHGNAIVGGYVYRGSQIPSLMGKYVYGNYGSGELYVMDNPYDSTRTQKRVYNGDCAITDFFPASFAEDENAELYVVSLNPGTGKGAFHIVPKVAESAPDGGVGPANLLSQTGCFESGVPVTPIAGAIPYEVNMELWSDGLYKRRWMALPDNTSITVESSGDWTFPIGTVLIKEFSSAQKLIETRMLVRHADGDWGGYTWVWNASQTDAVLAAAGSSVDPGDGGAPWKIPSRADCLGCHTTAKGRSLGPETRQMNRLHVYPGALAANQLTTLAHIGLIPSNFEDASMQPAFPQLDDTSASVESRVRTYLHANCSHCHPAPGAKPDLLYDTTLANTHLCEAPTFGVPGGSLIIAPGDAAHSIIDIRMNDLGQYRMPKLGTSRVDTRVIPLLESWINGMTTCP